MAPNMSMGVNLLFHLIGETARILGDDFDVEVVEAHHRQKKDAPSGTALRIAEIAAGAKGWSLEDTARYCRQGDIGARPFKEIGIQTVRGGDIVGEHVVTFAGQGERIEICHRAHSRDTFAGGAVRAALWVAGRDPGIYSMQDVLGIGA
jgi:4-hydroxy-tetrahydrodipicolinate reductase